MNRREFSKSLLGSIASVDVNGKKYEVDNIDPCDAEKIAGNQLRVRKLPLEEALNKYGHDSHH